MIEIVSVATDVVVDGGMIKASGEFLLSRVLPPPVSAVSTAAADDVSADFG